MGVFVESLESRYLFASALLDPTFGTDGSTLFNFPGSQSDRAESVAIQPDGKIVLAGISGAALVVARYNADGSLDPSFGSNGIVRPTTRPSLARPTVHLNADGSITTVEVESKGVMRRFLSDGSPDLTFASEGFIEFATPINQYPKAVFGADDSVLIGGRSSLLDPTFSIMRIGPDGTVTPTFASGPFPVVLDIDLDANGRSVVLGTGGLAGATYGIARFDLSGAPDATFGDGDGLVVTAITSSFDTGAIAFANGQILMAGNDSQIAIARFNADGTTDASFGESGVARPELAGPEHPTDLVVHPNGNIIVAGTNVEEFEGNARRDLSVTLLDPSGNRINSKTFFSLVNHNLILDGDGRIVSVGHANQNNSFDLAITRLNPDISLDATFGNSGLVTTALTAPVSPTPMDLEFQPNGSALALYEYNAERYIARFDSNGNLDPTFGQAGIADALSSATRIIVLADGRFFLINTGYEFSFSRFNSDGSLDTTFGVNGFAGPVHFVGVYDPTYKSYDLLVSPDQTLIVVGDKDSVFEMRRYAADGQFLYEATSLAFNAGSNAQRVLMQSDGKLIVAGQYPGDIRSLPGSIYVARFNPDFTLDQSFGGGGFAIYTAPPNYLLSSLVIGPDDGILVSAVAPKYGEKGSALLKLRADGTLDDGFGNAGVLTLGYSVNALLPLQYGRFLGAGSASNDLWFFARFSASGAIEDQFAGHPALGGTQSGLDLELSGDGKFVILGSRATAYQKDMLLTRYLADVGTSAPSTPPDPPSPSLAIGKLLTAGVRRKMRLGPRGLGARASIVLRNMNSTLLTGAGSVQFYLSTDGSLSSEDIAVGSATSQLKLKPGRSKTVGVPLRFSSSLPDGTYYLLATVTDPADVTTAAYVDTVRLAPKLYTIEHRPLKKTVQFLGSGISSVP